MPSACSATTTPRTTRSSSAVSSTGANTPRYAIEYLLYHEMLHLKHPVRVRAGRRCVHSREFQAEERLFPELEAARAYLKRL